MPIRDVNGKIRIARGFPLVDQIYTLKVLERVAPIRTDGRRTHTQMRQGTDRAVVRPLLGKLSDLRIAAPHHRNAVCGEHGGFPCMSLEM